MLLVLHCATVLLKLSTHAICDALPSTVKSGGFYEYDLISIRRPFDRRSFKCDSTTVGQQHGLQWELSQQWLTTVLFVRYFFLNRALFTSKIQRRH